jgi:murein DD-endopeptidase MepM/ murein hydrolase activator NlpD
MFASAPVNAPHHDYSAWDWGVPTGTPIYAVRGGTITTVQYWPYNWWDRGCTTRSADCSTCGIGVSITDESGVRWVYCHGSDVHARVGDVVSAGTQILSSGNTGRSSGPHLHLQIRTVDGRLRCPQPLLEPLRDTATGVAPEALPTGGCST